MPYVSSQLWAMTIAMFTMLPYTTSLKMDSKIGDLPNETAET